MAERVRIAIASPGDVKAERDAVPRIFNRWNEANDHAFLHPVMWEAASVPALGDHPQHLLNPRIIDKSDLLLAMFWTKLGTPTPTASSGTVEEIREFIAAKGPRRVMLYFCTRDLPYHTDASELAKLREFREQMRTEGIYHEYGSVGDFERDLYFHLDSKVGEFLKGELAEPKPEPVPAATATKQKEAKDLPADKRLHKPIDFGTTLEEIANGFAAQMDQFDAIDGVHVDKFYALGAHVYGSVAVCLDRALAYSGRSMKEQDRVVVERLAGRLKRLATNLPGHKDPFPPYWLAGREIANELAAHMALIRKWKR